MKTFWLLLSLLHLSEGQQYPNFNEAGYVYGFYSFGYTIYPSPISFQFFVPFHIPNPHFQYKYPYPLQKDYPPYRTSFPGIPNYSTPEKYHEQSFSSNENKEESLLEFDPTTHENWNLVNHENCGESTENRIIGGIDASLGQYPWIARVGYRTSRVNNKIEFKCGGTLINNLYVVTAGHCVMNLPISFKVEIVRLGEHNIRTDIDCVNGMCAEQARDYNVVEILVPKSYGQPKNANDIALLRLGTRVKFTKWIMSICLPFGPLLKRDYVGSFVEVAGWGVHDITTRANSDVLQTIKLPVLDISECSKRYRLYTINNDTQMCVGGDLGQDSCHGDSGGPLMKVEQIDNPKYYFFGIVSFGATYCGLNTNPAVYTKIVGFLKWILDHISV